MTFDEQLRFYKNDNFAYRIKYNTEFLTWLKGAINNGYQCYIGKEEIQDLINSIASWYELKYSERDFDLAEGKRYREFKGLKSISNLMDVQQLLYRLTDNQVCLMQSNYRGEGTIRHTIFENDYESSWIPIIYLRVKRLNFYNENDEFFLVHAKLNGEVMIDDDVSKYVNSQSQITMDELLQIFREKYIDKLKFTYLENCVNNHHYDVELRNRIFNLVALKLLYSEKTSPERGYERAKRFISEINKELQINLSTDFIDEIMSRDYISKKGKQKKKSREE